MNVIFKWNGFTESVTSFFRNDFIQIKRSSRTEELIRMNESHRPFNLLPSATASQYTTSPSRHNKQSQNARCGIRTAFALDDPYQSSESSHFWRFNASSFFFGICTSDCRSKRLRNRTDRRDGWTDGRKLEHQPYADQDGRRGILQRRLNHRWRIDFPLLSLAVVRLGFWVEADSVALGCRYLLLI